MSSIRCKYCQALAIRHAIRYADGTRVCCECIDMIINIRHLQQAKITYASLDEIMGKNPDPVDVIIFREELASVS